jgi:cellulose synthase/poly-beta-1,6-N-acetylglucosamine synthase-like glycosyltransferase
MNELPLVSIIIPCRNEEKFISKCLESLLVNDYPKDETEILVVDGMSQDETRPILESYTKKFSFIKLLDNPKQITPSALNIGIRESKGSVIIRIDSHAIYNDDYISKCVRYLKKYNADNVGGVISIMPRKNTIIGRGIAESLASSFGSGDARYKTGIETFKEVDTVPFGCFKREIFNKVGFFNENLKRSQDIELNLRIKKMGGRIYLFPDIVSYYYARSGIKDFFIHNFKDGTWVTYPLRFTRMTFRPRHYAPLVFVSGWLVLIIGSFFSKMFFSMFLLAALCYAVGLLFFSLISFLRKKDATFLISLPVVFMVRHFSYGFGELWGVLLLLIRPKIK